MSNRDEGANEVFAAVGKGTLTGGCGMIVGPVLALAFSAYSAVFYLPLWHWFVVPLGAPDLSFWRFLGLGLFLHTFTVANPLHQKYQKPLKEQLWAWALRPPSTWWLGFIIHYWLARP